MKISNLKAAAIAFALLGSIVQAKELEYFDGKINFWNESSKRQPEVVVKSQDAKEGRTDFPWKTFLDPKNKEFFKEGDYTPPEPFMEIARNPSDENIKQWFEFMRKKNELAERLQVRMQEYLVKSGGPGIQPSPIPVAQKPELPPKRSQTAVDANRFRIRMFFESTCPHCRRMFGVLKRLSDEGFQVEALQVDDGPIPEAERVVPIAKASGAELKKHGVQGVPFLLIADIKQKGLLPPVQGFHEYADLMGLMRKASAQ